MDISKTIEAKSDQLNADDLIGASKILKITEIKVVAGDQPVSIHYEGDNGKPYKPSKGMRRVLIAAWGADSAQFIGRSLKVYNDQTVRWAGQEVGGIRISAMSDIPGPLKIALTLAKGKRVPYSVEVLYVKTLEEMKTDCIAAIKAKGIEPPIEKINAAQNKAELSTIYKESIA
jgi:hypothetical protein